MTSQRIVALLGTCLMLGALAVVLFATTDGFKSSRSVVRSAAPHSADQSVPEAARILHAQLAGLRRRGAEAGTERAELALLNSLGKIYQDAANYPESIHHYALARDRALRLGDKEQEVASQTTLGNAYASAGRLQEAKQELEIAVIGLDQSSPHSLATLHGLANVLRDSGKFDRALELYKQAMQLHEKHQVHGISEESAGLLGDIGQVYHSRGDIDKAIVYYRQAVEQRVAIDSQTPDAVGSAATLSDLYNNLGQAIHDKGDVEEGQEYYRKALRLQQRTMAKDHPSITRTLINMARAQRDSGDSLNNVLSTLELAEAPLRAKPPTQEHNLALIMKADLLRELGRLGEAESNARLVLQTQTQIPGAEETPSMANTLNALGSILHDQQKFREAAKIYMQALSTNLKTVGTTHPETAATYNNLGNAYQDVGDDMNAEKYYIRCLEIQKSLWGKDNPDMAASYNNLATILARQGKLEDAEAFMMEALDVVQASNMPPSSPERGIYEENLADIRKRRETKASESPRTIAPATSTDPVSSL